MQVEFSYKMLWHSSPAELCSCENIKMNLSKKKRLYALLLENGLLGNNDNTNIQLTRLYSEKPCDLYISTKDKEVLKMLIYKHP